MFKNGVEELRRPTYDSKGKIFKFFFTEVCLIKRFKTKKFIHFLIFQPNFKAVFDLNNVYNQCKLADKKKNSDVEETSKTNKKEKKT